MKLTKFFSILKKKWYGSLIVFGILLIPMYQLIKAAVVEPLDIPAQLDAKKIPELFLTRLVWHISIVILLTVVVTLIIDLLFKKKNYSDLNAEHLLAVERERSNDELLAILKTVGITNASAKLKDSQYEPENCMKCVKKRLHFMGISGAKWITESGNAFEIFLRRIDSASGEVLFLLIDPSDEGFRRFKTLRNNNVESHKDLLIKLNKLSAQYKCLQVRLYNSLPGYRLISVDDHTITISPYRLNQEGFLASNRGWDNPHVEFLADAPWAFYDLFEKNFLEIWSNAKLLSTYMSEKKGPSRRQ